ncbi:hypothetical protein N7508_007149 [Penicillium antarcticum]|uniref:uncharacterized protein n=1 Tax=Penicillium antarcticum TaxID=416450 RepID=UPI002399FD1E|nr:uncharacterized protein N7508_007149 [Penicillium antarcticum]KAJ5302286.1 hypothetical protein N7508_007149 [Penicillium antarcticum]
MAENASLGQDTELIPIRGSYRSSDRLIHSLSEEGQANEHHRQSLDESQSKEEESVRQNRGLFEGWKFSAFLAFVSSVVVLLFNMIFLIYSAATTRNAGGTTLMRGDCGKMQHLSTVMHWVINLLGTGVLSASNFGMQCLVAPTRTDIDRAHKKHSWLDIGVPSVRNLFRVSSKRSYLCLFLSFSSLPFHLFYNSAIYYTTAVPAYDIFAGSGSLGQMNWSNVQLQNLTQIPGKDNSLKILQRAAKNGTLHRLESGSCIAAFAQTYQTAYDKLLLVTEDVQGNDSYALVFTNPVYQATGGYTAVAMDPYRWVCPLDGASQHACKKTGISVVQKWADSKSWTVNQQPGYFTIDDKSADFNIQYCLAKPAKQQCSLQYSPPSMIAVIISNIVKTAILLYIWLGVTKAPILTIGDGIASFLRRNDIYSQGMCLPCDGSATWTMSILGGLIVLFFGLMRIDNIGSDIWATKLGDITSQTIISTGSSQRFVTNSLIANSPQLIFSFLYVAYNSLLTSMCLSAEWSRFGNLRKGLRVSHKPMLSQRSNYFLSLPYRFAVPLMAASSILHWLVSQSLFVIAIEAYDSAMNRDPSQDVYACGYSPMAIIIATSVGVIMFTCLIVLSLRRFESAMPVASSCSLAIAAACHPEFDPNVDEMGPEPVEEIESEDEGEDIALLPLQWGSIAVDGPVRHCTFASGDVFPPEEGQKYQ